MECMVWRHQQGALAEVEVQEEALLGVLLQVCQGATQLDNSCLGFFAVAG